MGEIISFLAANDKLITAWTSIAALVVSVVSIGMAIINLRMQRTHNRKSVLPIGHFSLGDYEDRVFVRLRNDGVGPMLIDRVRVTQQGTSEPAAALIDFMPLLPEGYLWSVFVHGLSGRALSAEKDIILLELKGEMTNPTFIAARDTVRKALSRLSIAVEYKNIYGEQMPSAARDLSWFGRHFERA